MNNNSELISRTIGIIYPFILLFGFYITLNGHITAGGGFHGGAILSGVFISRYFVLPIQDVNLGKLQIIEKCIFLIIVTSATIFILMMIHFQYPSFNKAFLIIMNILIAVKVSCGLTIIFYRFVFYESR